MAGLDFRSSLVLVLVYPLPKVTLSSRRAWVVPGDSAQPLTLSVIPVLVCYLPYDLLHSLECVTAQFFVLF